MPERYSFWDLHVAIQDAMGWLDYHLHEFRVSDPEVGPGSDPEAGEVVAIGIPDDEGLDPDHVVVPGWEIPIAEFFSSEGAKAEYEYDFGDGWRHSLVLEKILSAREGIAYPTCVAGGRRCPPEDVGGIPGYEEFLRVIADPEDEEHERMRVWAGGEFDPEKFEPANVKFDDPAERWTRAFVEE